jgi:hypothetical protein
MNKLKLKIGKAETPRRGIASSQFVKNRIGPEVLHGCPRGPFAYRAVTPFVTPKKPMFNVIVTLSNGLFYN